MHLSNHTQLFSDSHALEHAPQQPHTALLRQPCTGACTSATTHSSSPTAMHWSMHLSNHTQLFSDSHALEHAPQQPHTDLLRQPCTGACTSATTHRSSQTAM